MKYLSIKSSLRSIQMSVQQLRDNVNYVILCMKGKLIITYTILWVFLLRNIFWQILSVYHNSPYSKNMKTILPPTMMKRLKYIILQCVSKNVISIILNHYVIMVKRGINTASLTAYLCFTINIKFSNYHAYINFNVVGNHASL